MFYTVLFQSRLVPRWISIWGLAAFVWTWPQIPGAVRPPDPLSSTAVLLHIPLAVQEMVLAVWFIIKGFSPSALSAGSATSPRSSTTSGSTGGRATTRTPTGLPRATLSTAARCIPQAEIWTAGAYKYPPVYAQLVLPIGFVPELLVSWLWRIGGVLCLRYLAGSWKLAVLAALQWPVFAELGFGNVTLQLGVVCLMCLGRGRVATAGIVLLPWFAGMKFGPALLLPYLWWTRPETRRAIVVGCAVFASACLASFAVAPGLWWDYAGTFGWEASSQMHAMFVYAIVPDHGGLDLAIRVAIGAAAILVAIRWRLDWLAFVAATRDDADLLADAAGGPGRALGRSGCADVVDRWRNQAGGLAALDQRRRWSTWTCCRAVR